MGAHQSAGEDISLGNSGPEIQQPSETTWRYFPKDPEHRKCGIRQRISIMSSHKKESRPPATSATSAGGEEGKGPLQLSHLVSRPDAEVETGGIELATGARGCRPHRLRALPARFNTAPCRLAAHWIPTSHILTLPDSCRRQKTCFFPILYIQEICTTCSLHVITHLKILHSLFLEPAHPSQGR